MHVSNINLIAQVPCQILEKGFDTVSFFAFVMSKGVLESFDLSQPNHRLVGDKIQLQNQMFPWVLYEYEGVSYAKATISGYRITERGGEFRQDSEIFDGMRLEIMERQGRKSYEVFLMHSNNIHFTHRYYYLENEIYIGCGNTCHVKTTLPQTLLPEHAIIEKQGTRYSIRCLTQQADVYVNGKRCLRSDLKAGDFIWCMGLSIVFLGNFIGISNHTLVDLDEFYPSVLEDIPPFEQQPYERVPRVFVPLERGEVEILPPTPKESVELPLYLTLGPAFGMSLGMLVSVGAAVGNVSVNGPIDQLIAHGVTSFSCFLGAMLWPTLLTNNQKKENEKKLALRQEKYAVYAETKTRELEERYNRNRKIWNELLAPSPDVLLKSVAASKLQVDSRLWERMASDSDFLVLRIGIGRHPFEVDIKIPPEYFTTEEDELSSHPNMIYNRFKTLKDVPETVSIPDEMCLGICGQVDMVWSMATALMIETMALHSPEDVKTVFFFNEHEKERYMWTKDLPSVWGDQQDMRFMATNPREANCVLRYIQDRMAQPLTKEKYVFFVSNRNLLPEVEINGSGTRIFYIFVKETLAELPRECRAIIRCQNNSSGLYTQTGSDSHYIKFVQDEVTDYLIREFRDAMMAVPYTPPRHGYVEVDRESSDRKVDLIDFSGQKMKPPSEVDWEEVLDIVVAPKENLDSTDLTTNCEDATASIVDQVEEDFAEGDALLSSEDDFDEDDAFLSSEDDFEEDDAPLPHEDDLEAEFDSIPEDVSEDDDDMEDEEPVLAQTSFIEIEPDIEEADWEEEFEEDLDDDLLSSPEPEPVVTTRATTFQTNPNPNTQIIAVEEPDANDDFTKAVTTPLDPYVEEWLQEVNTENTFETSPVEVPPVEASPVEAPLVETPPVEASPVEAVAVETPRTTTEEDSTPPLPSEEVADFSNEIPLEPELDDDFFIPPVPSSEMISSEHTVPESLKQVRESFINSMQGTSSSLESKNLSSILFDQGLFISGTHVEVVNNLMLTMAKFSKVDYVFSPNTDGRCSCLSDNVVWGVDALDSAIEEIREYVWSVQHDKCIVVIPSFHLFCEEASRRGLDRFTRILRKYRNKVTVITGDTLEFLTAYQDTEFLDVAVKQEQGIITDPKILQELLPYLPVGLDFPSAELTQTDFLYYNDKQWSIFYM